MDKHKTILRHLLSSNRQYEGYIWRSDQKYPSIFRNEPLPTTIEDETDGYIVEALLYSKTDQVSVSIRYVGTYLINEIDLKNYPKEHKVAVNYLPHRLEENNEGDPIKNLQFHQIWIPEPDPNCDGMTVLKMQALVFTGFNQPETTTI